MAYCTKCEVAIQMFKDHTTHKLVEYKCDDVREPDLVLSACEKESCDCSSTYFKRN